MAQKGIFGALAEEGHLKWEGKNVGLGLYCQWGPGVKPMVGSGELCPPEADDTFCEKMLFCHSFKNDSNICIHCLQVFNAFC